MSLTFCHEWLLYNVTIFLYKCASLSLTLHLSPSLPTGTCPWLLLLGLSHCPDPGGYDERQHRRGLCHRPRRHGVERRHASHAYGALLLHYKRRDDNVHDFPQVFNGTYSRYICIKLITQNTELFKRKLLSLNFQYQVVFPCKLLIKCGISLFKNKILGTGIFCLLYQLVNKQLKNKANGFQWDWKILSVLSRYLVIYQSSMYNIATTCTLIPAQMVLWLGINIMVVVNEAELLPLWNRANSIGFSYVGTWYYSRNLNYDWRDQVCARQSVKIKIVWSLTIVVLLSIEINFFHSLWISQFHNCVFKLMDVSSAKA